MKRKGIRYLTDEVNEGDLEAVRRAIDDLPEGSVTVQFPEREHVVVTEYDREKDRTSIALGSKLPKGAFCGTGTMDLDLEREDVENFSYRTELSAFGGERTCVEIETRGHRYLLDGVIDLEEVNSRCLA